MNDNLKLENKVEEDEIDLLSIIKRLFEKKRFILKILFVFIVLGLLVAITSPKVYTAGSTIVPQVATKGGGSLSGLASMVGINLGDMGGGKELSPNVYPKIVNNVKFLKELMYTRFKFDKIDTKISLLDFYTNPDYRKSSVIGSIKKYTIGLPGLAIKAIKGKEEKKIKTSGDNEYFVLSTQENICKNILKSLITINLDKKEGYITLSVDMPEANLAAQVALRVQQLLEEYIIEFKIKKAKNQYNNISRMFEEAKDQYDASQVKYAKYLDANKDMSSALAKTRGEQLKNEFDLAATLYKSLAQQKVRAEVKLREDTPVLTIVEPVVVPNEKTSPKRGLIMVAFTFLGLIFGCGAVIALDWLKENTEIKRLKSWK